jgi:flagellar assembly protein FliH
MSRLLRRSGGDAASLGSFVLAHGKAGFRPNGGGDGGGRGGGSSGGFTPGNDTDAPLTPEQERARIREEAYALGCEEGRRTVEAEFAAERDALGRLAESLAVLRPEPANALALLLAETVDRLVRQVAGEVEVDGALLIARANAAALLIGREVEPTKLRVHPADLHYLETAGLEVPLEADPSLTRGAIVLETGHGWVEDGPAVRLERLRAELDKMVAAR